MRKVTLITVLLLLFYSLSFAYDRGHAYISGTVDAIGTKTVTIPGEATENERVETIKTITISGVNYKIAPECRIIIYSKNSERSSGEKPAKVSDIQVGDSVTAKKIGKILYEIMVAR